MGRRGMSASSIKRKILKERNNLIRKLKLCERKNEKVEAPKKKCNAEKIRSIVLQESDEINVSSFGAVDNKMQIDNQMQKNLIDKLKEWYSNYHPTRACIQAVLNILNSEGLNVPISLTGLLKHGKSKAVLRTVSPGKYLHIGLEKQLRKIPECALSDYDEIILDIGVDGSIKIYVRQLAAKNQQNSHIIQMFPIKNIDELKRLEEEIPNLAEYELVNKKPNYFYTTYIYMKQITSKKTTLKIF